MTLLQVFQCKMLRLTEFLLQLLYGWDRGLQFHIGHECSSLAFVVCCVGSDFCDELITHSEDIYRVCVRVFLLVCDLEASTMRRPKPDLRRCAKEKAESVCRYWTFDPFITRTDSGAVACAQVPRRLDTRFRCLDPTFHQLLLGY